MIQIPFRKLPSTSALFNEYITDWTRVRSFYPQNYSVDSIADFARRRPALETRHREKLCAALLEQQKQWGGDTTSVDKLASGAVAVIGGQQPGLFTGPGYTIFKTLTVIKLAQALERMGVLAVPVFWIAAEDHDHEEIQWATVLDRNSSLQKIAVDFANGESAPAGWLHFREDVEEAVSKCLSCLPESEFQPAVSALLNTAYKPLVSPVEAFAKMMARLFEGTGLILANPLHDELKRLAAPTLSEAVRRNGEIRSAVLARSGELLQAGYHEQVKVDNNFTGLFAYHGKSRQPVRPEEIRIDAPLSPNVLLRPAVQDVIFPTAAYVGGPAEIAYFAQARGVYDTLQRPMPPVFPRISATILEARVARPLKKYDMEFADAFRGREFMKRKAVESVQGVELFDRVGDRLTSELESLRSALNGVDPTLTGALDTSKQKILHQVEGLRTKFVNAEARRNETLERHMDAITNSLFPEKKLQERVINITSFLVRYGLNFVEQLDGLLSLDCREHQVIDI